MLQWPWVAQSIHPSEVTPFVALRSDTHEFGPAPVVSLRARAAPRSPQSTPCAPRAPCGPPAPPPARPRPPLVGMARSAALALALGAAGVSAATGRCDADSSCSYTVPFKGKVRGGGRGRARGRRPRRRTRARTTAAPCCGDVFGALGGQRAVTARRRSRLAVWPTPAALPPRRTLRRVVSQPVSLPAPYPPHPPYDRRHTSTTCGRSATATRTTRPSTTRATATTCRSAA